MSPPRSIFLAIFLFVGISLCSEEHSPKIFQIGFNKCGTKSLSEFFQKNNIKSVHWEKGEVAQSFYKNYLNGEMLISEKYGDVIAFFDLEFAPNNIYIAQQMFKELDLQYPGSKFILNTRDKKKWLKSRNAHKKGLYLEICAQVQGVSISEMFSQWSQEWDQHHANVLEYFKDRPKDLIVFDIEKDPISKLCEFFEPYYSLDAALYEHLHKGTPVPIELEHRFKSLWKKLQ